MRKDGKLDYLEMHTGGAALTDVKTFYANAFGWAFTDYGPSYAAYDEGLEGGFDASPDSTSETDAVRSAMLFLTTRASRPSISRLSNVIGRPVELAPDNVASRRLPTRLARSISFE